jgi:probable HAF family extracellular repeat protein
MAQGWLESSLKGEESMKSTAWKCLTGLTLLAVSAAPIRLAAQEQENKFSSTPRTYTVQVLPDLGGLSGAFSINDRSWVAGISNLPGDAFDHALLWRSGEMTDLGTLGGYNRSVAFPNKNEIGWLAGFSETMDDDPYQENFCQFSCSLPTCAPLTQICRGFLWRDKTNEMIALPPLPRGNNSMAFGANNQGQVVGVAENGVQDPNCVTPQVFDFKGVVWSLGLDGTPFVSQRLAPIAGDAVSAGVGINAKGDVVGASGPCASIGLGIGAHAVLWKSGRAIDLGNLGGVMNNLAFALNNQGQIVGISDLPGDNVTHAFLWAGGAMKDMGTLRSDDFLVLPESINDRGEVVGFSCGPIDCRGFHWQGGVMIDLNSVLPADSPLLITNAADINSLGEIAVQAFDSTVGDFVAAVLTPSGNDDGHALGQRPGDNSAFLAAPTEEGSERRGKVILPENVREQLRQRLGFGWFGAWPIKPE